MPSFIPTDSAELEQLFNLDFQVIRPAEARRLVLRALERAFEFIKHS